MNIIIFLFTLLSACSSIWSKLLLKPPSSKQYEKSTQGEPDRNLILTPYIENGDIQTARNLSAVTGEPFPDNVPSYSGYFTVNKEYNSNLFFWFIPAKVNYEESPVILWLEGGPGAPSVPSAIYELGPFTFDSNNFILKENPYSWNKFASLLFIDNPVGTGFSYTTDNAGYATNQTQIGNELYSALIQFFTLFPELQKNEFYIAGESYGGKYAPAAGYVIFKNNPSADLWINLKGLIISSGFTDPISMMHYSDHVYELGLIDENIRDLMREAEEAVINNITAGYMPYAFMSLQTVLQLYLDASNMNTDNVLDTHYMEADLAASEKFFTNTTVTEALHTGNVNFSQTDAMVYSYLIPDILVSQKTKVEELLDNGFRVLYFNGQFDVNCAYALMKHSYNSLIFNSAEEYKTANRTIYFVDDDIAGYYKSAGNFTEVMIRNAGHLVPRDQSQWVYNIVNLFIMNKLT